MRQIPQMSSRVFDSSSAGAFRIGVWHRAATQAIFDWEAVQPGQRLGPFEWIVEPYEAAILCYQLEINDRHFLPTRDETDVVLHPFIASRASLNLLQAHYKPWEGAFLDYEHVLSWSKPLIAGSVLTLAGEIVRKYEKRGRYYLEWSSECRDLSSDLIFKATQKVVSPAFRSEKSRSGESNLSAPRRELSSSALEEINAREIYCFLAWSRRNSYPPHPNLHTDFDRAQGAGFPNIIMQGALLGAHVVQAAVDHYGDRFCYGSVVSFKLVRPILTETKPVLRTYLDKTDDSLVLDLRDGDGHTLVVGKAKLANKS
jgi:hypothetical protein